MTIKGTIKGIGRTIEGTGIALEGLVSTVWEGTKAVTKGAYNTTRLTCNVPTIAATVATTEILRDYLSQIRDKTPFSTSFNDVGDYLLSPFRTIGNVGSIIYNGFSDFTTNVADGRVLDGIGSLLNIGNMPYALIENITSADTQKAAEMFTEVAPEVIKYMVLGKIATTIIKKTGLVKINKPKQKRKIITNVMDKVGKGAMVYGPMLTVVGYAANEYHEATEFLEPLSIASGIIGLGNMVSGTLANGAKFIADYFMDEGIPDLAGLVMGEPYEHVTHIAKHLGSQANDLMTQGTLTTAAGLLAYLIARRRQRNNL